MGQAPRVQSQVQSGSDSKPGWFGSYGWALGYKTWVGKTMECVQFKVQAKKKLKSKPTFWDGTGPRGPNSGSIRVRFKTGLGWALWVGAGVQLGWYNQEVCPI